MAPETLRHNSTLQYRAGPLNKAADALLRQYDSSTLMAISSPILGGVTDIKRSYSSYSTSQQMIKTLQQQQPFPNTFPTKTTPSSIAVASLYQPLPLDSIKYYRNFMLLQLQVTPVFCAHIKEFHAHSLGLG